MMKHLIQIILVFGILLDGFGQSIDRTVIGSAGQYSESTSDVSLNYTVGEAAVALLGDGPSVAEGFHRTTLSVIVSTDVPHTDWSVRVFPNPTSQWLQVELPGDGAFDAQLNSTNGQLLWEAQLQPLSNQINLSTLPAGIYWLSIRNDKGEQQRFQIVKADF